MSDAGTERSSDVPGATPRESDGESDATALDPDIESVPPSDAFEALGNETRMAALRELVDGDGGRIAGRTATFSELFDASPADTTAGFAYHLRQLTGQFLHKTGDEGDEYALTYAGLAVARAIAAGTYTDRVSFGPVSTGDACPLCDDGELRATCEDNYVTVACGDCARAVLTLPFPPGARGSRGEADPERLLDAFDRHHRHRLSAMSDGACPECAAPMDATLGAPADAVTADLPDAEARRAQVSLDCEQCGCRLDAPVTLAVLEHPAVVAFFHDHGENVRDRPVWNVGDEWRETVISDDPWRVRVSAEVGEEALDVFVGEDLTVAGTRRRPAERTQRAS
jgi:hypothetical protein